MVNLQFSIPEDLSFEQAIVIAQEILTLPDNTDDTLREKAIAGLLRTNNGARGWFVGFLTGASNLADHPTPGVLQALHSAPQTVADLMTKNLAMSTAMEVAHRSNHNTTQAAGSARVKQRSSQLIRQLQSAELQQQLQHLHQTLTGEGEEYQDFLTRWGYDSEQRQAIQQAVAALL